MNPSTTHGAISWAELMSSDPAGAVPFYCNLFGWKNQTVPMPHGDYHLQMLADRPVAGLMALPQQPMDSCWGFYATVDDVDAAHSKALSLGAREAFAPMDVDTVGRMSGLFDPEGAYFSIIRYLPMDEIPQPEPDFADGFATPGAFSWFHLTMHDVEAARRFYSAVLGWEYRIDQMPGGPYVTIAVAGVGIGGIIPPAAPGVPAHWSAFVTVSDVDATLAAARAQGGSITVPGWDIPGVGRIGELADPAGATIWVAKYQAMP